MKKLNLGRIAFEYDESDPEPYRSGWKRLGADIGATMIGATVYEIPPGKSICPYHYEYGNEEWAIVLAGNPSLRHPSGEDVLEPLDAVCFPVGPDGAHKLTNGTAETVRVMLLSTKNDPAVVVYPDSDKIGAWSGRKEDQILVRRESAVEYYEGEL